MLFDRAEYKRNEERGKSLQPAASGGAQFENLGKFSKERAINAIAIKNIVKNYLVYDKPSDRLKQFVCRGKKYFHEFCALKNISFEVKKGETVGIVGQNGSGKSTLLQIICGTLAASAGEIDINGRISALLELGTGFNPEFTGRENIFLSAAIQGLSRAEIERKYDSIAGFANIGEHLNQPVKTYSSGMYVRLAFAVAIASDPDILIVDEALAVGDEAFQRKCFARIREIRQRGGTVLFVSHSAGNVMEICDRAILLDQGEMLLEGSPKDVLSRYHKLIFTPEDRKAAVRAEIIKHGMGAATPIAEKAGKEHFDANFISESMVSYEKRGAEISNLQLENLRGERVNLLEKGLEYIFAYNVKFTEDAESVKAGMMIKTRSGIEIGGASTATEKDAIDKVPAGTELQVKFTFRALLNSDSYFLNAGCSGIVNGERVFLHRLSDAIMFKVAPETDSKQTGIVDFLVKAEINE